MLRQDRESFVPGQHLSSIYDPLLPISRLSNPALFNSANCDDFREMIGALSDEIIAFKTGTNACIVEGKVDTVAVAAFVQESNSKIEESFHLLWVSTLLHLLPTHIYHYREPRIISCDVKRFLLDLLEHSNSTVDAVAAERASHRAESLLANIVQLRKFSLDDLVKSCAKLYSSSPNLFHIFYLELLSGDTSPVFRNLLIRHCDVLDNWRF